MCWKISLSSLVSLPPYGIAQNTQGRPVGVEGEREAQGSDRDSLLRTCSHPSMHAVVDRPGTATAASIGSSLCRSTPPHDHHAREKVKSANPVQFNVGDRIGWIGLHWVGLGYVVGVTSGVAQSGDWKSA
jgi:hypothetical protein